MGTCNSCNAIDADEVRYIDADYTPQTTLLKLDSNDSFPQKHSGVKCPIIVRKQPKRASTTHAQSMELLGPILRSLTSEDRNSTFGAALPEYSECYPAGALPPKYSDLDIHNPETNSIPPECLCPDNHEMKLVLRNHAPYRARCDGCGKRNIDKQEAFFHCTVCDYDRCVDCAKFTTHYPHLECPQEPICGDSVTDSGETHSSQSVGYNAQHAINQDKLKNFHIELARAKVRFQEMEERLKIEETMLLRDFHSRNHTYLTSVRQRAFMFFSRAFECNYRINRKLLHGVYELYSQKTGDINEVQMSRLLTECNKAFAQLCKDAIKRFDKKGDSVSRIFVDELKASEKIYKDRFNNLSTKQAKKARKKFEVHKYGGVLTLEAFCENIGPAIYADQMSKTKYWNQILAAETPEQFFSAAWPETAHE